MERCANRGAAMDVGGWLRRLGLEQYEAVFRQNKIDDTVLPSLTVEDLKDLGVGFVGDRRKLLDAIAALRGETSAPAPLSDAPLAIDEAAKDSAERRQVGQDLIVDLILAECRLILFEAKPPQPTSDIHSGTPATAA